MENQTPIFKNGKPSLSMGHLYHGYVKFPEDKSYKLQKSHLEVSRKIGDPLNSWMVYFMVYFPIKNGWWLLWVPLWLRKPPFKTKFRKCLFSPVTKQQNIRTAQVPWPAPRQSASAPIVPNHWWHGCSWWDWPATPPEKLCRTLSYIYIKIIEYIV